MKILKSLNKKEANELFEEYAILIGNSVCITYRTVVELFGIESAKFPQEPGIDYNIRIIGGKDIKYLYINGFYKAVTHHNIKLQTEVR